MTAPAVDKYLPPAPKPCWKSIKFKIKKNKPTRDSHFQFNYRSYLGRRPFWAQYGTSGPLVSGHLPATADGQTNSWTATVYRPGERAGGSLTERSALLQYCTSTAVPIWLYNCATVHFRCAGGNVFWKLCTFSAELFSRISENPNYISLPGHWTYVCTKFLLADFSWILKEICYTVYGESVTNEKCKM